MCPLSFDLRADKPIVLYMVVGLGSGMLIITSMVLMVMALLCLHHKQKMVEKLESQVSIIDSNGHQAIMIP
jgi:hypothetical protein